MAHINRVIVEWYLKLLNSDFSKTFHQCSVSVTKVSSSTRFSKLFTWLYLGLRRAWMTHLWNTWGSIWTITILAIVEIYPKLSLPFFGHYHNRVLRIDWWGSFFQQNPTNRFSRRCMPIHRKLMHRMQVKVTIFWQFELESANQNSVWPHVRILKRDFTKNETKKVKNV